MRWRRAYGLSALTASARVVGPPAVTPSPDTMSLGVGLRELLRNAAPQAPSPAGDQGCQGLYVPCAIKANAGIELGVRSHLAQQMRPQARSN